MDAAARERSLKGPGHAPPVLHPAPPDSDQIDYPIRVGMNLHDQ